MRGSSYDFNFSLIIIIYNTWINLQALLQDNSFTMELLHPKRNPQVSTGRGPKTLVGRVWTPISGVNTSWVVKQRSNPAPPGFALTSSKTDLFGWAAGSWAHKLFSVSKSGPGAGPSSHFRATEGPECLAWICTP